MNTTKLLRFSKVMYWLFLFCGLLGTSFWRPLQAQTTTISGTVRDKEGQPLSNASVAVKNGGPATTTDQNGQFSLTLSTQNPVLVISFTGYLPTEIPVRGSNNLELILQRDDKSLDQVVVIGYGTVKKSSVTAAISKIENKQLDQLPAGRAETALAGRMAGVNVSSTRARPGEAPVIRVRGASSLDAGNDPLVVIDGFPGSSLDNVNMNDVESIEVLKDASAAAIYGSRGSGGVIIVTTKKGKTGKPQLSFNSYAGVSIPRVHHDWISSDEYYNYVVKYLNREYVWAGGDPSIPVWGDPRRPANYQVNPVIKERNVNWQNEVLHTAPIQNYNLAVAGGTDNAKYYVSGTYRNEQGTLINTWYKSYSVRANVDFKISPVVNAGFMINPNYNRRRTSSFSIEALAKYPPFVAVRNPDGTYPKARDYWGAVVTGGINPLGLLYANQNYSNVFNNIGEIYVGLNLMKGLKFRSSVGANITYSNIDNYQAAYGNIARQPTGSAADYKNILLLNENVLSYDRNFGNHHITAIVGQSTQTAESRYVNMGIVAGSYSNNVIQTLNNAVISPTLTSTTKSNWGLLSYFGRINYDYKEKYLLAASLRRDGSSRFAPDNKWGLFPAASAAWNLSKEDFLIDNKNISHLKLRVSYGKTGNFNIPDFGYLGSISNVYYSPNNTLTTGQAQTNFGNQQLGWEENNSYDLGIELGLLNNRINFVFDYYNKKTSGLLYQEAIPATTGFSSSLRNTGVVSNKGIELELNTKNMVGRFGWQTSFNLTVNRNKVVSLGGASERINTDAYGMGWILRVGEPMFSYYGYKKIGVLQDADDVANSAILAGSLPGNTKYLDVNKDGSINASDRVILGNFQPKMLLGMVNDFTWKSFDLSIIMQSSIGAKLYNFENQYYQGALAGAMRRSLVETQWWSTTDPGNGQTPGAALSKLTWQANNDFYIEDASFLAVRNINLGYNLPNRLTDRVKIKNLRVYTSMTNVLILTKKGFHGYNPEGYSYGEINGLNSKPGYNSGSEPIGRTFVLGVNVNF